MPSYSLRGPPLAGPLKTIPETISRTRNGLKKRDLITVKGGRIKILYRAGRREREE